MKIQLKEINFQSVQKKLRGRLLFRLASCLLLSASMLSAEEEVIDLEEAVKPTNSAPITVVTENNSLLKLGLYADMVVDFVSERSAVLDANGKFVVTNERRFDFDSDHLFLIGTISWRDKLTMQCDLTKALFFEMRWQIKKDFYISMGKIMIPFGEYNFHHIYGGKVDWDNEFFNYLPADWGIGVHFPIRRYSAMDIYTINGFRVADGSPLLTHFSGGRDNNMFKALGFKYRIDPTTYFWWSASLLFDQFSSQNYYNDYVLMFGTDVRYKYKFYEFKAGMMAAEVVNNSQPVKKRFIFKNSWYRWGWYTENNFTLNDDFKIRLRAGTVDGDSRYTDSADNLTITPALIFYARPFIFELNYYFNKAFKPLAEFDVDKRLNAKLGFHEILLVALMKF